MNTNFQSNVLRIAKVVDTSPKGNALDLVYLDTLGVARNAQVMSQSAGTDYGSVDMPEPTKPKSGTVFDAKETKDRDIYAVVAMVGGEPLVLGYIPPQVNQMAFDKTTHPNLKIQRHASDFYQVTDNEGNTGWIHPSGSTIKIGSPPSLDGADYDKKWKITKNKDSKKSITLTVPESGSITIDTAGTITITAEKTITITAGKTITISAGELVAVSAERITLN